MLLRSYLSARDKAAAKYESRKNRSVSKETRKKVDHDPMMIHRYLSSIAHNNIPFFVNQGVTKRCRLSWLTNSALVYEPKCGRGEGGGVVCGVSDDEYSCAHGALINSGVLTPY